MYSLFLCMSKYLEDSSWMKFPLWVPTLQYNSGCEMVHETFPSRYDMRSRCSIIGVVHLEVFCLALANQS